VDFYATTLSINRSIFEAEKLRILNIFSSFVEMQAKN